MPIGKPRNDKHPKEVREYIYRNLPKPDYLELSGLQTAVLHNQGDRWGIPLRGGNLDLYRIIPALHRVVTKIAKSKVLDPAAVRAGDDAPSDPLLSGSASPALEQYRQEKFMLARLQRLQAEGQIVFVDDIADSFNRIAAILRDTGEKLQRQFGNEASDLMEGALIGMQKEVEKLVDESKAGNKKVEA